MICELETRRLWLRQWRPADKPPFAALNSDPRVMEYFPAVLSESQSNALADRCAAAIAGRGWGLWAAEMKDCGSFLGFVGLNVPSVELPFSPCVEIGWRLASRFWGRGYATEAAREALRFGFEVLDLEQIVSFTAMGNLRSIAVMQRLNMSMSEVFDHPEVPVESGLRQHCLYRIGRTQYNESQHATRHLVESNGE